MKTPITDDTLAVEYVDIDVIRQWPGNPKEHDIGAIAESVLRFGFRDPIAVNRRNHLIEEGHGRIETLLALKRQRRPAPRFIRVDGAHWLAPVLWFDDDEVTQHGYALAHNRTHDLGGGYDDARLLAALLEQQDAGLLAGIGYDGDDVASLRQKLETTTATEDSLTARFAVIVMCADEQTQRELLEEFLGRGFQCRALIA